MTCFPSFQRKRGSGYLRYSNVRDQMGPKQELTWRPTVDLGEVVGSGSERRRGPCDTPPGRAGVALHVSGERRAD